MRSALRDAVTDGVSLKHTFQRLPVQAETIASAIHGVYTFDLRTLVANAILRPKMFIWNS